MTPTLTIRDCIYAVAKHYGVNMEELSDTYPTTYAFVNKAVSIKLYRLPIGLLRMQIIPLDDVMNDQYIDIRQPEDIYAALEPYREVLTVKQMDLFKAW